ncbi:MAG: substrate-binding domain-containing protein [Desulfobacteraceae bacterium]|nr:substrate-binding domain-containing protein [Desulfobacteraceae bacterium]
MMGNDTIGTNPGHRPVMIICLAMVLLLALGGAAPGHNSEHMTIHEYQQIHPEQKQIAANFKSTIRKAGVPVESGVQDRPVKVAIIYPALQLSDYWRNSVQSFKNRMDEIGIEFHTSEYYTKPTVNHRLQERQIKKALGDRPDYLIFTLDAKKHRWLIEQIITQKKPKIILQNITTPLRIWEGKQPFLYVGFDHIQGTLMLAEYLMKKNGNRGKYALLYFSEGYVSRMRGNTFSNYLDEHSQMELVAEYYTGGDSAKAEAASMEIVKSYPDIKFIYSCSTDISLGAARALQQTGFSDRVMINGWGGGAAELNAMALGRLEVTVMRMNDDNGVAMAEAIRLDLAGRSQEVPVVFCGDMEIVNKTTPLKQMERLKERAFRYSGGQKPRD